MEDIISIKAEPRTEVGKKIAKQLRKQGKIPAIIYGEHKESMPITLPLIDVKNILRTEKKENTVIKINRDDIEVDAMLKEIQYDYLDETIIHADFIRIDLNKPVSVSVPISVQGEPIGVKLEDGIFDFMTREIKIRCLPTRIPTEYIVDVSGLHSGHSLKAENMELGEDVKLMSDPQRVICTVLAKGKKEEEAEVAAVVEEGAAAPGTEAKPEKGKPETKKEEGKKE